MFFNRPEPLLNSTNISLRQTFLQSYMKFGHEMWLLQCLQGFSFFWANDLVIYPAWPSFELDRDIIETNLLTNFHEDQTINVASRVFTNKCGRTDGPRTDGPRTDGRQTKTGHKSSPEQSGELKKIPQNRKRHEKFPLMRALGTFPWWPARALFL